MNVLYPGRPDYTGLKSGLFGFVHHHNLCELSDDIFERVNFIVCYKLGGEIPTRLHCLVHIPEDRLPGEVARAIARLEDSRRRWLTTDSVQEFVASQVAYFAADNELSHQLLKHHDELEKLMLELVPDVPWNGDELMFGVWSWVYKTLFLGSFLRKVRRLLRR